MKRIINFLRDESGAETIEYVLVAAGLVIVIGAAYTAGLGGKIATALEGMID